MNAEQFTCADCHETKPVNQSGGTGYGKCPDTGNLICYGCCGKRDAARMAEGEPICLYLSGMKLTNWPGTLTIEPYRVRHGRHNIARSRCDVWFAFAGRNWHGVQYGENSEICRCKPTK